MRSMHQTERCYDEWLLHRTLGPRPSHTSNQLWLVSSSHMWLRGWIFCLRFASQFICEAFRPWAHQLWTQYFSILWIAPWLSYWWKSHSAGNCRINPDLDYVCSNRTAQGLTASCNTGIWPSRLECEGIVNYCILMKPLVVFHSHDQLIVFHWVY